MGSYMAIHNHLFLLHVCCSHLSMLVAGKREYNHKALHEKCQALKNLEKGISNKDLAAKYGVPKNTSSTWIKNKERLLDSPEKGSRIKQQKLRS